MVDQGPFNLCSICGEFAWLGTHRCAPKWRVAIEDYQDLVDETDRYTIYAVNAREAAEKAAAKWERECVDWAVASGREIATVHVWDAGDNQTTYIVEGETLPRYHATEKEVVDD